VSWVYESSRARVYQGDALSALDDLRKEDAQLIVTDPPYGVRWQSSLRTEKWPVLAGDDGSLDVPGILGAYTRKILHANSHVYVFGFRPAELAAPLRLAATAELVWDKGRAGLGDLSMPWGPSFEPVTFGVYTDCNAPGTKRGGLTARMRRGAVLRADRLPTRGGVHPTQKPVALMRQLVESSSVVGDTVLDPFAGSGSTGVAAILLGRKTILVELDPGYCETTVARVRAAEALATKLEAA
jgi:tRNA G10  N-methylase Trm11